MKILTRLVVLVGLLVCCYGISNAAMVHQYTFNTNSQAEDSVGAADLTINGTASVADGVLTLPGGGTRVNNASAAGAALTELASTINGTDALTIEIWFTQSEAHDWAKLFMTGSGAETNYMDITPRRGNDGNVSSCSYRNGTEVNVKTPGSPIVNNQPYYMACVWDETNDVLTIYRAQAGNVSSAVTATTNWTGGDLAAIVLNEFYLGSAVYFGDGDYVGQIDEFRIYDTALSISEMEASLAAGPTRETAQNPDPTDGQTLVSTNPQLSWDAPNAYTPDGYDVYIGTDPNVDGASQLAWTSTTIDPAVDLSYSLTNETTYYWRVDAMEPNGLTPIAHTGTVWSFTTLPPVPVVTMDPVSQTVASGTTIDLTVTALNTDTYTWYQSVDAVADAGDTNLGSGSAIQVTVDDISKEGWYYCVASGTAGSDTSAMAHVMMKRLVGYWDFEGNLDDSISVGPTHDGSADEPNFVAGVPQIGGQGYQFFGDGRVVTIADSTDYFNFYPQGFTIFCWVKGQNPSIWDTVCSKEYEREIAWNVGKGFYLGRSNAGAAVFAARPAEVFSSNISFTVADWHQLAGVHDPAAGVIRIYFDGVQVGELATNPASWNRPNLAPLIFGAESTDGTIGSSSAAIDELKIYNYALDATEIAQQYVNVMGGYICIGGNPTGDLSGDCQVDLSDLQVLAENWLASNRVE